MYVFGDYKESILLAALVVQLLARHRSKEPWVTWVGVLLGVGVVVELAGKILAALYIQNHLLYNLYFVVEYGVITWLLYRTWPRARILHWMIVASILLLVPVLVWDVLMDGSPNFLATNALITGGFLLGLLTVAALFILVQESAIALHHLPLFWVLLSIMVYYLTFIPIFGLYNYLAAHDSPVAFELSNINDILFAIRYGLLLVGLVMLYRQPHVPHGGQ